MSNYNAFKKVFLTRSDAVLSGTIAASKKRWSAFETSGNDVSAAVEIDRIQAAADVLDDRGFYNDKAKPEQADSLLSPGIKVTVLIAAGLLAALFLSS